MRARALPVILSLGLLAGLTGGAPAQQATAPDAMSSPILTLDSERVFGTSAIGRKITAALEADFEALVAENRRIEADLTAEELDLTRKRAELPADEFHGLADAFDAKVKRIRAEQDAKQRALQQRREEERQDFVEEIAPILADLGRERGAIVILERRNVVLSAESADITDEVIERINARLADGEGEAPDDPGAEQPTPGLDPAPR